MFSRPTADRSDYSEELESVNFDASLQLTI